MKTPAILVGALVVLQSLHAAPVMMPVIDGEWWTAAGDPNLDAHTDPKQQPVDFAVWPAEDGTWQLWSCIRGTKCGGKTRLFHRWEGKELIAPDWKPMGIAMEAKTELGETAGGLQAPHVVKIGGVYHMFYGDWENICVATSEDGKAFNRRVNADGKTGMFSEGQGNNTRDAMLIRIKDLWHCYYTAYPNRQGAVYCRTSKDTKAWSESKVVAFGGEAGTNAFSQNARLWRSWARASFICFAPSATGRTRSAASIIRVTLRISASTRINIWCAACPWPRRNCFSTKGQWYSGVAVAKFERDSHGANAIESKGVTRKRWWRSKKARQNFLPAAS